MTSPSSFDSVADSLLVHASFVQRLARSLAGQEGDDLAQDTWAAALQGGREDVRSARGWLAAIAANLWRNRRRDELRRTRREAERAVEQGATAGETPSVAAILQREEVRRQVVAAVVALPEPLRTVVLHRFFEGLDSTAIGRRLQLPPSTVRARLAQALERLRTRLDAVHGERRAAWTAPIAALAAGRVTEVPAALSALGHGAALLRASWPLRAALGAIAALLLAWFAWPFASGAGAPPPAGPVGTVEVAANERDAAPRESPPDAREPAPAALAASTGYGPEDLWGRVVAAADGRPIAGAEVALEHRDADEMHCLDLAYGARSSTIGTARTAADGGFAFRVRRALQHRVSVRAAGFASVRRAQCTGGGELVVRLERSASVEGVVRRADGAPLPDVPVEAAVRGGIGTLESTRTAADGSFFLAGIGTAPTYVYAQPPRLLAPEWRLVELAPGEVARVEFVVERGRAVSGVVRDADSGQPIAGASIATAWTFSDAVTSRADGTFELTGAGEHDDVHVRAGGYAEGAQRLPEGGDDVRIELTMQRGFAVLGRVLDGGGRPIAGAFVAAAAGQVLRGSHHTFWRTGTVAPDGRFRIDGLARTYALSSGETTFHQWQLLARAPERGARVLALPVRQLQPGDLDVGDVVLAEQALVEGRVVDVHGHGIAGARVQLSGTPDDIHVLLAEGSLRPSALWHFAERGTRTAADGTFRFAGIGAGTYGVGAELEGRDWRVGSGPLAVVAGTIVAVPDLVADPGLSIEGRLRGDGAALPAGTRVSIYAAPQREESGEQHYAIVGRDGSFRIEQLAAGPHHVFAFDVPPGFAVVPKRDVAAGTHGLELALVPAATIEGRVVGADGRAVAGMSVHFVPEGVNYFRYEKTDADGRFRIEAAPGVTGKVTAQDPANMFRQTTREQIAAGARDLVLELPR